VNRIQPEQKKRFPEVLCVFSKIAKAKIRLFALQKILLSTEMALRRRPPAVSYHHAGANCSARNPPPRGNPGLKCTLTDATLKKFDGRINLN
jgi:hypothetical protein